jgi:large repetitive protein
MRVSSIGWMSIRTSVLVVVVGGCSGAHLNEPPELEDFALTATEDTPATAMIAATDADRDGLQFEIVEPPAHGLAAIANGTLTYTPEANYNGDDALALTVYDTKNPRITANVAITVLPVNDAPAGTEDSLAAVEDVVRTIAISALVQNDTDIDGDALTISGVAAATHGTVALSGTDVVFTPDANFVGEGSFEYTLDDGGATATVAVTVDIGGENDAPVAVNDAATTAEDTPIDLTTLVANDTDLDGQVLTIDSATPVTGGGTVGVSGNTVTFTPAANFHGTATFTYVVTDGAANDTGTVTVTVTSVNDAPVATDDVATIDEDTPTTFSALGGNDTDVDLETLAVTAVANPNNGAVVLNGGQPIFTPDAGFSGSASFEYTVSDGAGGTDAGLVSITVTAVNDAPIAVDDSDTTTEDNAITFTALTGNDTDAESDTLTVTAVSNAANGSVILNGGAPIFTPDADFSGTASFDYTVGDGNGAFDTGSVMVTVTPAPDVSSVTPATVSVEASGGTAILTVSIDTAAGSGGVVIDLASSSGATIAVPTTVTVPQGATSVGFRIRADATAAAGPITITASLAGTTGTATSAASVVTSVSAPTVGDLVINEIHYDVLATVAGDANCDGVGDAQDDEFVELSNRSNHPVQMQAVSLWDNDAFGGTLPVYSFPAFVLGSGETVVVFGGLVGTTGTSVWCTNLDGAHIGDARAFGSGKAFALNNTGGDTVHVTANTTVTSTELLTGVAVPTTSSKQAYTRDPDFTGAFVKDGTGIGAADRNWSPGTLVTGEPFAAAGP